MKKIATLLCIIISIQVNAQMIKTDTESHFDDNGVSLEQIYSQWYLTGIKQVACGGITLATTTAFSITYFSVTSNILSKGSTGWTSAKVSNSIGIAVTGVGVLCSAYLFARGYRNITAFEDKVYLRNDGTLCFSLEKKRKK